MIDGQLSFFGDTHWKKEIDLDALMLACSSCGCRVIAKPYGMAVGTHGFRHCPYCGKQMMNADRIATEVKR